LRVTVRVMVESGIPSAKQKLARAEKHLRALDRAVKKLRRETPYDFTEDYTPNKSGKPDFYLRAVVLPGAQDEQDGGVDGDDVWV